MKIYLYNEKTMELDDILTYKNFESLKTILYNLSDKNNGYLLYPQPLQKDDVNAKQKSDDFKFYCRHIYENNGYFLSDYQ